MTNGIKIAPSILSADFANMATELKKLEQQGADYVHVDVMDGHFVPNMTFGAPIVKAFRPHTQLPFDVHLMIENPQQYIDDFAKAGANIITIHYEAVDDLPKALAQIKAHGVKAGVSIKPGTDKAVLDPYMPEIDLVLVMTVEPGFGGQSFMAEQMDKVRHIRAQIKSLGLKTELEVDGGIAPETIAQAYQAGADVFVAGSAVFKTADYKANMDALRTAAQS